MFYNIVLCRVVIVPGRRLVYCADDGPPLARQLLQVGDALEAGRRIEPGSWLVEEHDGRVVDLVKVSAQK